MNRSNGETTKKSHFVRTKMPLKTFVVSMQSMECSRMDDLYGAGNGDRTRGIKLGKLALFQLSYARLGIIVKESKRKINSRKG
jgi:hypothetical protein